MGRSDSGVPMGFTRETYPAGTHMCLIYSGEAERREMISKFLEAGISGGERVVYFADVDNDSEVPEWLVQVAAGTSQGPKEGQYSVLVAQSAYCLDGEFSPEAMLITLRYHYEKAIDDGFCGIRVSGEMSWALKGIPGSERLMEYEALVNEVLAKHPITAICQYNASLFDTAAILDVLRVHPLLVIQTGQIVLNPYYMSPQEFLKKRAGK